jgi:hypothetical protein
MRLNAWAKVVAIVALAVGMPRVARADDPAIPRPTSKEALEHLAKGSKLYGVGEWAKAADEYKAGALIEEAPIFDYDLGQAYRQAGEYKLAIWHYKRFLKAYTTPGPRMDSVQKFIADMQAELDQKARKEEPTEPASVQSGSAASEPAKPSPTPVPPVAIVPHEREHWYEDWFGWGLAGTGVVGVAVGGALLLDASSLNDQANHTVAQQEAQALHDKADTRSLLGTVIGIGGLGLVATGAIKLAVHPSEPATQTASWSLGVSSHGVFVFGRF